MQSFFYYINCINIFNPNANKMLPPITKLYLPKKECTFLPNNRPAIVMMQAVIPKHIIAIKARAPIIPRDNPTEKLSRLTLVAKSSSPNPTGAMTASSLPRSPDRSICKPKNNKSTAPTKEANVPNL